MTARPLLPILREARLIRALDAPFGFEKGQKEFVQYLQSLLGLQRETEEAAVEVRTALSSSRPEESYVDAYQAALDEERAASDNGFEAAGFYIDFLAKRTPCVSPMD